MPYYPDEIVNDVFAENDIVDYISKYVNLKKSGRDYSGLCPFHKEKSPSFHVSSEKQLFHCFGCGASGNLVQFVMRTEGLDFVEALKLLAERAGIQLPEDNGQNNIESGSLKKKIYEMNKLSARFFYENLTKHPEGKTALAYFSERKISKKTIISYGLGFARDNYTALHDYLLTQGYSDDEMLSAGLIVLKDDKLYDKFRNRVMFPIIDLRGNIIGFGGRIMGEATTPSGFKLPKYLNTAETPVFNKGKNLFSLNLAKKSSPVSIILAEGYMDVISVFQSGITNIVATLGTALTENQAKLLMKYCNEILICYDSDEAGQKATIRAIEIINSVGGRSKVIKLKDAKDPDEYIKNYGAVSFAKAMSDATPSTAYRIGLLKQKYSLDSPEGKSLFISEACDVLKSIKDAVEVDAYINQLSTLCEVSKDAIYSEYKKKVAVFEKSSQEYEIKEINREKEKTDDSTINIQNVSQKIINAEKKLILLMAENKKYFDVVMKEFNSDDFSNEIHKKLVEKIKESYVKCKHIELSMLINDFTDDSANYASNIFYNMEEYKNTDEAVFELIKSIKIEKLSEKISKETDAKLIREMISEISAIRRSSYNG